jgi:hypothetical protein
MMTKILTWLFGAPEEINGHERCPTYLYRWPIFKHAGGMALYVHHFVGDDWSRDQHDHPKRFISIGLRGRYIEETPNGSHCYHAPWIRSFPATHIHRLRTSSVGGNCWTLVLVLRTVREWGFWHSGKWYPWRSYVNGNDSALADRMRDC